jgi:ABC-type transport system substrate-binding protein
LTFTNLTVNLKSNITFHDGTIFNASVVKWCYDRLQYFTSGRMIEGTYEQSSLIIPSNESFFVKKIPILNDTLVLDNLTVKFILNFPFTDWETLMGTIPCSIVLPDENCTYGSRFYNKIDITVSIVGTGPYQFDRFINNTQVDFSAYSGYHQPRVEHYINKISYVIEPDENNASSLILGNYVYWADNIPPTFSQPISPDWEAIGVRRNSIYYMHMNTQIIPFNVRKASHYCWNSSYLLFEVLGGRQYALNSPIPKGCLYHSSKYQDEDLMNISRAREYILNSSDISFALNVSTSGLTINSPDYDWIAKAQSTTPLAWYNYSYQSSGLITLAGVLLQNNLKMIGIRLELVKYPELDWYEWINRLKNETFAQSVSYTFMGFRPRLSIPWYYSAYPYMTNGIDNMFNYSDLIYDELLNETSSLSTTTSPILQEKYDEIQEYFVESYMPCFHCLQLGDTAYFNSENIKEESITEMLNIDGIHFWFKVQFYPPKDPPPNIDSLSSFWKKLLTIGLPIVAVIGIGTFTIYQIMKKKDQKRKDDSDFRDDSPTSYTDNERESSDKMVSNEAHSQHLSPLHYEINIQFQNKLKKVKENIGNGEFEESRLGLLEMIEKAKLERYHQYLDSQILHDIIETLKIVSDKLDPKNEI